MIFNLYGSVGIGKIMMISLAKKTCQKA